MSEKKRYLVLSQNYNKGYSHFPFWSLSSYNIVYNNGKKDKKFNLNKFNKYSEQRYTFDQVTKLYENLLIDLSKYLNKINKENMPIRYWEYIIGIWLIHYLNTSISWYNRIQTFIPQKSKLHCIMLNHENFVIPYTTLDSLSLLTDDFYNSQILTQLAIYFKLRGTFVEDHPRITEATKLRNQKDTLIKKSIRSFINKIQMIIARKSNVIMVGTSFTKIDSMKISLKSKFKIVEIFPKLQSSNDFSFYEPLSMYNNRYKLKCENRKYDNDFESFLYETIHTNIPIAFIEKYSEIKKNAFTYYKNINPEKIFTTTRFWFDEYYKQWAATSREKGVKLIHSQHGLNYSLEKWHIGRIIEEKTSDNFIYWGNQSKATSKIYFPTPLWSSKKYNKKITSPKILYCGTSFSKYFMGSTNNEGESYIKRQFDFFNNVNVNIHKHFLVRLYQTDYEWNLKRRLSQSFKNLNFDSHKKSIENSIVKSKILVCDNISTTIVNSIIFNKPTIIFWPTTIPLTNAAQDILQYLKNSNVYHETPLSAANWINRIHCNPEQWWFEINTQKAIREFQNYFIGSQTDYLDKWIKYLIK